MQITPPFLCQQSIEEVYKQICSFIESQMKQSPSQQSDHAGSFISDQVRPSYKNPPFHSHKEGNHRNAHERYSESPKYRRGKKQQMSQSSESNMRQEDLLRLIQLNYQQIKQRNESDNERIRQIKKYLSEAQLQIKDALKNQDYKLVDYLTMRCKEKEQKLEQKLEQGSNIIMKLKEQIKELSRQLQKLQFKLPPMRKNDH